MVLENDNAFLLGKFLPMLIASFLIKSYLISTS